MKVKVEYTVEVFNDTVDSLVEKAITAGFSVPLKENKKNQKEMGKKDKKKLIAKMLEAKGRESLTINEIVNPEA